MRVLLRVLAPLIGLAMAVAGVVLILEVLATWTRPGEPTGMFVPWPDWRRTLESVTWAQAPAPGIGIGIAAFGLLLVLVGLLARRHEIALEGPAPEITVTTSPRVLARLVGRRVRATDGVAAASVTASGRKVSVAAESWNDAGPQLRSTLQDRVRALLDELPLRRRPRVVVSVAERRAP